jgi:quaternary ammonium compound-resistance protein SugE
MAWICLLIAALFEIAWAVGMKHSHGFTRLWPTVYTFAASLVSFVLLAQATKTLPLGTSYAVWTGIGAAGTAAIGILWFSESANLTRLICIALIVAGVVGLKLNAPDTPAALQPASVGERMKDEG